MALANENPTQAQTDYAIAHAQARGTARALAQALINYDRNPEPMRHREAPNPAHEVSRIRMLRPAVYVRVNVDAATKAHNDAVAGLRKP